MWIQDQHLHDKVNQATLKLKFRGGMSRFIGRRKTDLCALKYIWFCFCINKSFSTCSTSKVSDLLLYYLPLLLYYTYYTTDVNVFCTATKDSKVNNESITINAIPGPNNNI